MIEFLPIAMPRGVDVACGTPSDYAKAIVTPKSRKLPRSCYCTFDMVTLTPLNKERWDAYQVQNMTYIMWLRDRHIRVVVKLGKPRRMNTFCDIKHALNAYSMHFRPQSRFVNPLKEIEGQTHLIYKTLCYLSPSVFSETVHNIPSEEPEPVVAPVVESRVEMEEDEVVVDVLKMSPVDFVKTEWKQDVDLVEYVKHWMRDAWEGSDTQTLLQYDYLEYHRKLVVLLDKVDKIGRADVKEAVETLRSGTCIHDKDLVAVDPITIVVPVLVALASGDDETQVKRVRYVNYLINNIVKLYNAIVDKVPDWKLDHLQEITGGDDVVCDEQTFRSLRHSCNQYIRNHCKGAWWVGKYVSVSRRIFKALQEDTVSKKSTHFLPATASFTSAKYNPARLLKVHG